MPTPPVYPGSMGQMPNLSNMAPPGYPYPPPHGLPGAMPGMPPGGASTFPPPHGIPGMMPGMPYGMPPPGREASPGMMGGAAHPPPHGMPPGMPFGMPPGGPPSMGGAAHPFHMMANAHMPPPYGAL